MKNWFTRCWVSFRDFHPFSCLFIYTYRRAVSEVSKVRPISAYRWNLILFVARHVIKSHLHKEETSLNISGKEVDLARNLFHKQRICHQKSINIQQSFRLGRRATLYREGLINVNKNLDEAVYYGVPFPPKFNVPFYIVLCTIYRAFCVCHLSLNSRFHSLHSTFNFDLCNIQVCTFDIQLFISNSQVF